MLIRTLVMAFGPCSRSGLSSALLIVTAVVIVIVRFIILALTWPLVSALVLTLYHSV